jgi:hypothetical protein
LAISLLKKVDPQTPERLAKHRAAEKLGYGQVFVNTTTQTIPVQMHFANGRLVRTEVFPRAKGRAGEGSQNRQAENGAA